jgi:hypothetical protein
VPSDRAKNLGNISEVETLSESTNELPHATNESKKKQKIKVVLDREIMLIPLFIRGVVIL